MADVSKDYIDEKKSLISDFNEAKFQILRLNYSWTLCNSYRRQGRLRDWRWELDTIWDELSSKAEKRDKEYYFGEIKKFDETINKIKNDSDKLYFALREKHRFLKKTQDDVGMGGKMRKEDEDEIEE